MYSLSSKSLDILKSVHPDLYAVVRRAIRITIQDFAVFEGIRSIERQRELFNAGKSQTMNSRHLTGHAVDLVPWVGKLVWDHKLCLNIWVAMSQASIELDVPIEWGGNWVSFVDSPHYQLPKDRYP